MTVFKDDAHRQKFEAARARACLGGVDRECCGARLRTGGFCALPVVSGCKRCRKHGGPAQAQAVRQKQLVALSKGELSPADFERFEKRRAANRLTYRWRSNPWLPGATIDLAEHEGRFRTELAGLGFRVNAIPPAVLDSARWKFRRMVLDRGRSNIWTDFVTTKLQVLIDRAGAAPPPVDGVQLVESPAFVAAPLGANSKRRRPDEKVGPAHRVAPTNAPIPAPRGGESEAASRALWEHRAALAAVLGLARSDADKLAIGAAFVRLQQRPGDPDETRRWADLVRRLKAAA